jgi:uncharacterized protein
MTVVMMKPTNLCNLRCLYCYNDPASFSTPKNIMSRDTMAITLEKISEYESEKGRVVTFEWIGGEPLLVGVDFYKNVVEKTNELRSYGFELKHCIQSNGTLMSREKAQFFFENGFEVSFSLDGTREINDRTRKYPSQRGAFDKIMEGIRAYKAVAGRCGVICVVTRLNIQHISTLYDFCKEEGIGLQLNSLVNQGGATESIDALTVTPGEYADAVMQVFELWLKDDGLSLGSESRIESAVMSALLERGGFGTCIDRTISCQDYTTNNFICVNPLGDVYPCTSFDGYREFWLGNIHHIGHFSDIAECSKRQYLAGRNQRIADGKGVAIAGCMHKAYVANGHIDTVDPMVETREFVQSTISARVNTILQSAKI